MTVPTTNTQSNGTGDGVNPNFDFSFKCFAAIDVQVYLNGVLKTLITDYTVTLNANGIGGTVHFIVPPGAGVAVVMNRLMALTQGTRIPVENKLAHATLENLFDRLTMLVQQVYSAIVRSFTLDPSVTNPPSLIIPAPEADKVLGWNSSATALENKVGGGGTTTIVQGGGGFTVPAGVQNQYPRVNSASTGFDYKTPAQIAADINIGQYILNKATSAPATPFAGQLWWNSLNDVVYQRNPANNAWNALWKVGGGLVPVDFVTGAPPTWQSASTTRIPAGFQCNDSTNRYPIVFSVAADVILSASGVNGLDTGSEAIDRTYHLYAIADSNGVNTTAGLWSVTNEKVSGTITLPTGYDIKRQLTTVRNDHSGNIIPYTIGVGWPGLYLTQYDIDYTDFDSPTLGATNIINVGTPDGAFHTVVNAGFFSPNATIGRLNIRGDYISTNRSIYFRKTGSGLTRGFNTRAYSANVFPQIIYDQPLDTSQQFDYKIEGNNTTLYTDAMGYFQRL